MRTFKERLDELFEEAKDDDPKCTQVEFADQCGITIGQLTGYSQGNGEKFCKTLGRIAMNKGVSVAWLIGISDDRIGENVVLKETLNTLLPQDLYVLQTLADFMTSDDKRKLTVTKK